MRHTVLSLFCGAGGCSLGFQQAGYEVLRACDLDRAAIAQLEFLGEDLLDFTSIEDLTHWFASHSQAESFRS